MSTRVEQEPSAYETQPTMLRLFREPGEKLASYRQFDSQFRQYLKDKRHSEGHWDRKTTQVKAIEDRLVELINSELDQSMNLVSSISAGMAYLKFVDDFTNQGFAENQIFDFFNACLAINTQASVSWSETLNKTDNIEAAHQRINSLDFTRRYLTPLGHKLIQQNPLHLRGATPNQYNLLINQYGGFNQVLNPNLDEYGPKDYIKSARANLQTFYSTGRFPPRSFGVTYPEGMPDWLDIEDVPQKVDVEAELEEDRKALAEGDEQIFHIFQKRQFLTTSLQEKKHRAQRWLDDRMDNLWMKEASLGYLLLYLHQFPNNEEGAIRVFAASKERLSDPQTLQLFIEEVFQASFLIKDGTIDPDQLDILKNLLAAIKPGADDAVKILFRSFREVNKKGFNALNFELGGFLRLLTSEDVDLFEQFLADSKEDGTSIIEFLADLLEGRLREVPLEDFNTQPLKQSAEKYQQFLRKFLRQYWPWLLQQFQVRLYPDLAPKAEDPATVSAQEISELTQIADEFEENVDEVEQGTLSGWQVYYAPDLARPQHSLTDISGQTLEEKALFLNNFFTQSGISCSIKPDSVVAALDWKVRYPQEHEALVPIKTVGFEDWKKIKRGAVRIFYQRFLKEKRLLFHVHQKKAWAYGF